MGGTQSAYEEGEPGQDAAECRVQDVQQCDDEKLLKNNGQIAAKSDTPLVEVYGICEDDTNAEADGLSEKPPKEVETLLEKVVVNKESIKEEDISLEVTEVETKHNNINESFKTFFSKVGLKFTLKRGSRDHSANQENGPDESTEVKNPADQIHDDRIQVDTACESQNEDSTCPTVVEDSQNEADSRDEEWTHLDTPSEQDPSSPSSAKEYVTMSPIKMFFTTGIFAGLVKKRMSLEDETMTRELVVQQVGDTAKETTQDQQEDTEKTAVSLSGGNQEENPSADMMSEPEAPKEIEDVPLSPLKRLLLDSSLMKFKRQKDAKQSEGEEYKPSSDDSDQLLSPADMTENDKKQIPAQPAETTEEESPWATFKKLLSPKKRVNRCALSNDDVQTPRPKDELKPSKGDDIFECRVDEDNTWNVSAVSWDAILCARSQTALDSDRQTPTDDVNCAETVENYDNNGEILAYSPKKAASPPEGDVESAWTAFKRLMSPKRKAKPVEERQRSPETDGMQENSFSAKFFPGWKKRKSISNKDQEAPLCEVDQELGAGDLNSEMPVVVPLSNYDTVETEPTETVVERESSTKTDAELNQDFVPEVTEAAQPSDNLQTEEIQPSVDASENEATNEDLANLTESIVKALSDIPEEGELTESTTADNLIKITSEAVTTPHPVDVSLAGDSQMISARSRLSEKSSGAITPVLAEFQVKETEALMKQVFESISTMPETDPLCSDKMVCFALCDTLRTFGDDLQLAEVQNLKASITRTDLVVNEMEVATDKTESSEVNKTREITTPISTEDLDNKEITPPISTKELVTQEITATISTEELDTKKIPIPIQREELDNEEMASQILIEQLDIKDIKSLLPTNELDTQEITPPFSTTKLDALEIKTPIPTEKFDTKEVKTPTSKDEHVTDEITPPIPTEEFITQEITTHSPAEDLDTKEITPPILTEELDTQETTPPIPGEELKTKEIKTLIPTEDLAIEEITPTCTEECDTEETTPSVPTKGLDVEDIKSPNATEELDSDTSITTEKIRTPIQTDKLNTKEIKPPILKEEVDIQETAPSIPTEELDTQEITTAILDRELKTQEITPPIPTEKPGTKELKTQIPTKEFDIDVITPPACTKEPDTEEITPPTTTKELDIEEIKSPIPTEQLDTDTSITTEKITTPIQTDENAKEITPPIHKEELETQQTAPRIPTESLDTQEITAQISSEELNTNEITTAILAKEPQTQEITPPIPTEELETKELKTKIPTEEFDIEYITPPAGTEEPDTEEIIPSINTKELDIEEIKSPIPTEELDTDISITAEKIRTPIQTDERNSKEITPPVLEEELDTQEMTPPIPTEELDTQDITPPIPTEDLDIREISTPSPNKGLDTEEIKLPTPTKVQETEEITPPPHTEIFNTEEIKYPIHSEDLNTKEITTPIPIQELGTEEIRAPTPPKEHETEDITPPIPTEGLKIEEIRTSFLTDKLDTNEMTTLIPLEGLNAEEFTSKIPIQELHTKEITPSIPTQETDIEGIMPLIPTEKSNTEEITSSIPSKELNFEACAPQIPTEELDSKEIKPPILTKVVETKEISPLIAGEELDREKIIPLIPTEELDAVEIMRPVPTQKFDSKETKPQVYTEELDTEEMTTDVTKETNLFKSENNRKKLNSITEIHEFVDCLTCIKQGESSEQLSKSKDASTEDDLGDLAANQSETEASKVDDTAESITDEPEREIIDHTDLRETYPKQNTSQAVTIHLEEQKIKVTSQNFPAAFTEELKPTSEILSQPSLNSDDVSGTQTEVVALQQFGFQLAEDEILSEKGASELKETNERLPNISFEPENKDVAYEPMDTSTDELIKDREVVQATPLESEEVEVELVEKQLKENAVLLPEVEDKPMAAPEIELSHEQQILVATQKTEFESNIVDVQHVELKDDIYGEDSLTKEVKDENVPLLETDVELEEKDQKTVSDTQIILVKEDQHIVVGDLSVNAEEIPESLLAEDTMIAEVKYRSAPLTEGELVSRDQKAKNQLSPEQELVQESFLKSDKHKEVDEVIHPQKTMTEECEEEMVPQLQTIIESAKDDEVAVDASEIELVNEIEGTQFKQSIQIELVEAPETIIAEEKMTEELKEETVCFIEVQPERDQKVIGVVKTEGNPDQYVVEEGKAITEDIAEDRTVSVEVKEEAVQLSEMNVEPEEKDEEAVNETDNIKKSEALASEEANVESLQSEETTEGILVKKSLPSKLKEGAEPLPELTLQPGNKDKKKEKDLTEGILSTKTEETQKEAMKSSAETEALPDVSDEVQEPEKVTAVETETVEKGARSGLGLTEEIIIRTLSKEPLAEEIPKPQTENETAAQGEQTKPQTDQALDREEDSEPENTTDDGPHHVMEGEEDGTPQVTEAHISLHQEEKSYAQILEKIIYEEIPEVCGTLADQDKPEAHPSDVENKTEGEKCDQPDATTATVEHALVTQVITSHFKKVSTSLPDLIMTASVMQEPLLGSLVPESTETAVTESPIMTDDLAETAQMGDEAVMMHVPVTVMEDNHSIEVQVIQMDITTAERSVDQMLEVGIREKGVIDVCNRDTEGVEFVSAFLGVEDVMHEDVMHEDVMHEDIMHEDVMHEDYAVMCHEIIPHVKENQLETLEQMVLKEAKVVELRKVDGNMELLDKEHACKGENSVEAVRQEATPPSLEVPIRQESLEGNEGGTWALQAEEPIAPTDKAGKALIAKEEPYTQKDSHRDTEPAKEGHQPLVVQYSLQQMEPADGQKEKEPTEEGVQSPESISEADQDKYQDIKSNKEDFQTPKAEEPLSQIYTEEPLSLLDPLADLKTTEQSEVSVQVILTLDSVGSINNHEQTGIPEENVPVLEKEKPSCPKEPDVKATERQEPLQQKESTKTQKQTKLLVKQARENQVPSPQKKLNETQQPTELLEKHVQASENQAPLPQKESTEIHKETELQEKYFQASETQEPIPQNESAETQKHMELVEIYFQASKTPLLKTESTETQKHMELTEEHEQARENQDCLPQKESTETQKKTEQTEEFVQAPEREMTSFPKEPANGQKQEIQTEEKSEPARELESTEITVTTDPSVLLDYGLQTMETEEAVEEIQTMETEEAVEEILPMLTVQVIEEMQPVEEIAATANETPDTSTTETLQIAQRPETEAPIKEAEEEQDVWVDAKEEVEIQEETNVLSPQDVSPRHVGNRGTKTEQEEEPKTVPNPDPGADSDSKGDNFAIAFEESKLESAAVMEWDKAGCFDGQKVTAAEDTPN